MLMLCGHVTVTTSCTKPVSWARLHPIWSGKESGRLQLHQWSGMCWPQYQDTLYRYTLPFPHAPAKMHVVWYFILDLMWAFSTAIDSIPARVESGSWSLPHCHAVVLRSSILHRNSYSTVAAGILVQSIASCKTIHGVESVRSWDYSPFCQPFAC